MCLLNGRPKCLATCPDAISSRMSWSEKSLCTCLLIFRSEKFAEIIDPYQKGLNLTNCQQSLTIDFFKALGKAPLLTRLVVNNSKNINDLVFSAIAKVPH